MLFFSQKNRFGKFFCFLLAFLFTFSALAQEDSGSAHPDSSEPTIQCQDLPKALQEYNADIQLNQDALTSALTEASDSLEKASNNKLNQSELLEMSKNLKEAKELSQGNAMILSNRKSNIKSFLEKCLKRILPDHMAQENRESANPDSSETTIECQDLPKTLQTYNTNIQSNQSVLTTALTEAFDFLEKSLTTRLNQLDFQKMIQNLKEAKDSRKNEMILLDRKSDIEYFLEECVKKIKTDS